MEPERLGRVEKTGPGSSMFEPRLNEVCFSSACSVRQTILAFSFEISSTLPSGDSFRRDPRGLFHVEAEVVEGEVQSSFSYAVPDDGEVSFLCISAL